MFCSYNIDKLIDFTTNKNNIIKNEALLQSRS